MRDRLLGVFAEAVTDGAIELTAAQLDQLCEQHERSQAHALYLARTLLQLADAFADAGIEFRVLKGAALAHLVYENPSWRVATDVDLLIPSGQFDVAVAVDGLGGVAAMPELRPGFDREFGKASLLRIGRFEIDLHRTFVAGPFGLTIDLDELFTDGTEFAIGNRPLLALGVNHLFLHACYNAALGDYPTRLCAIRDLLLVQQHLDPDLDDVLATARRWKATAVVQRAAAIVADVAGSAAQPIGGLISATVPRREAWLLRSYLSPARSYSRPLASLAVISGFRPRLRYGRALVAPSAQYLRSRGWSERTHITRARQQLRLRRRG